MLYKTIKKICSIVLAIVLTIGGIEYVPLVNQYTSLENEVQGATAHTQSEAINWVRAQVGKKIDCDGIPVWQPYQCVDLVKAYYSYLGAAQPSGNGVDYTWNALPNGWQRIKGAQPQVGDILVYEGEWAHGNNGCGHVAIYESDKVTYHQNVSGPYVSRETYRYNGFHTPYWGVIRPNWKNIINYTVSTGDATNITNTTAKITGGVSPSTTVSSWGFYINTNTNYMTKCTVSAGNTSSSSMSANVNSYYTLKYGTKYYYKVWAKVNGSEKIGPVKSFTTRAEKPGIPTLKVSGNADLGLESSPTVTWNATTNAKYYKLYMYDENENIIESASNVTGTKWAFSAATKPGKYTIKVEAYNEVGTAGASNAVSITVHQDVKVTFKDASSFVDVGRDYVPSILGEETVHYGASATAPKSPEHKGYTFSKWSKSFTNVKANITVEAVYEINQYTVTYIDSNTNKILDTKKIEYYSAAPDVGYDVPTWYVETGYDGWDKDHSCITEDIKLYTSVGWYNFNFPIGIKLDSAVREYDAQESDNEGYTVNVTLTNWDESTTKGRVVVALKTKAGKLLTSTESSAFSMKKSTQKQMEIFVPYDKAATIAEVYVVGQYKEAVPISTTKSNNATIEIDQSNTYTNWSTDIPDSIYTDIQSRKEYRYRDKTTTTSYSTSLAGYTQNGSSWIKNGNGTIDYVTGWPSGFSRSNYYYNLYNKSPKTASETATDKTTVSTSTVGYLYWHWCRGYAGGPANRLVSDCWESSYCNFHAFVSGSQLGWNSSGGAYYGYRSDLCKDTYWWLSTYCYNSTPLPVRRCSYTTYKKLFNYYKWSDYSNWSTTEYTASNNRQVEDRTVYRYRDDSIMEEDNTGKERTVTGSLGKEFAGKEATLFIYKVDEASDYTNEYVAQTLLDDQGCYEFHFKLREEPSAKTGDMTVVLGVEGNSTAIYLDTIKAPKAEYTVRYYDAYGKVISTQKVLEGENAEIPGESKTQKNGYTLKRWSDTNTNINEDKEIYPEYEINTYNVVFVDWEANTIKTEQFEYGSQLITPMAQEPDNGKQVDWCIDMNASNVETTENEDLDENYIKVGTDTIVTGDMVVCTRYTDKKYSVQIQDFNGNTIDTQEVYYGKGAVIPELDDEDGKYVFLGWENAETGEGLTDTRITQNTILCPKYIYSETVAIPQANVESGEYDGVQTVELATSTDKAVIYYTLDGSDPTGVNGILYTEPIKIDDAVILKYYAAKAGMNDSSIGEKYYTVNYQNARSPWLPLAELPKEVKDNMGDYLVEESEGYSFKDIKTTKSISEANALEESGWKLESQDTYTAYSDWTDEQLLMEEDAIDRQVDTRPVMSETAVYEYSHYVYTDGTDIYYSPIEVEGYECKLETKQFNSKLSVAGFDDNNNTYFIYDGQQWFSQKKVTAEVQTGTQYRYRYKVAKYYKWSEYTTDKMSADETREYKTSDVYSYIRHNTYLVTLFENSGMPSYQLIKEGKKIDFSDYKNMEGFTYAGAYTGEDYSEQWLEDKEVTESVSLYIKADRNKYNVTFAYEDGTEIDTQKVDYMSDAIEPTVDDIDGYHFVGWSSDQWQRVERDTIVTAKYVSDEEYATVSLDNETTTLYVGKSIDLTAIVTPSTHDENDIEWSSSDESIAIVSEEGTVTAINKGEADIIVKVKETGETAICKVIVKVNNDTTLSIMKNSKLSVDDYGYLRGVSAGENTVNEVVNQFENSKLVCKDAEGNELSGENSVGTGAVIYLMNGSNISDQIEVVVTADITGDGVVNNRDVAMLMRALIDKETPTDCQILASDVNGDGNVNNKDAALISRSLVGKETIK